MPAKSRYSNSRTQAVMEADERRRQADPRRDKSFGNPLDDMTTDVRQALGVSSKAGPLFAERARDAEHILNDTMRLEQAAASINEGLERGMPPDAAARARDQALRDATKQVRPRRMRLASHLDGLPAVLQGRAFPEPSRSDRTAEVKADAERALAKVKDNPVQLAPAMVELARDALKRGDTAMVGQLAGTFGQTLMANSTDNDRDAKVLTEEVRSAIIQAAQDSAGALTDAQRSALSQLDQVDDLDAAVTGAVLTASMRFDKAVATLPWNDDMERDNAMRDLERNPFHTDRFIDG